MMNKNLILILIDGGRVDRATNSNVFNNLKSKSVFFPNTITYGPHTIAAMHAVFSGTYGTRTGTNSYWSTYKFKKNHFKTISEYMHELDYFTHADVVNELVIPKQGLDEFQIHDEINDDLTIRHIEIIKKLNKKFENGQNFFLFLQFSNIHTGIMNEVLKVYDNHSEEYFNNKEKNEKRYDSLFHKAEDYLSKILNTLDDLKLVENSIILVMSDHGISIGEKIGERAYGAYCYDYTLKTFAYFLIPNISSKEITQQIRTIDFMPTLLDYLQIPLDSKYETPDGESLIPLINGKQVEEKIAYSETGNPLNDSRPPKEPNTFSVRNSKWKLIFNQHNNTKELYDLSKDHEEKNNLSGTGLEIESILWNQLNLLMKKN